MPDPIDVRPRLEARLGSLVFQLTVLEETNAHLQARIAALEQENHALKRSEGPSADVMPFPSAVETRNA